MDDSNKETSRATPPNIELPTDQQPTPPKAAYLSVFDRAKSPPNVPSKPTDIPLDEKFDPLEKETMKHQLEKVTNLLSQPGEKEADPGKTAIDIQGMTANIVEVSKCPHDLSPESSASTVCEFCLSKEELHKLKIAITEESLSGKPAGDKLSSTTQQIQETISIVNQLEEIKEDDKKDTSTNKNANREKSPTPPPVLRLRDIQQKLPQQATAIEALGKYFNVTVVSPKLEPTKTIVSTPKLEPSKTIVSSPKLEPSKTIVSKVQQEQADEIPRTKSEEFTPMAQEEEEVKRLIEEVRKAGEQGDQKEATDRSESTVLEVPAVKLLEAIPPSVVSLKESESSDLSLQSATSSVHSLDYCPDIDDSGLEDELEEMARHKFVLLRRIPNTFPFAKDCLNVMDVTDRDDFDGKSLEDPLPLVSLTVRGIVPLNPDGTPLPYQEVEPEMGQEVDLTCHCCHVEVLPMMSDGDLDDDNDDELLGEDEQDVNSSVEELRKSFGMKNTSLSSLDAIARTVSNAGEFV